MTEEVAREREEKGIEKGKKEQEKEIALKMLEKAKLSVDDIADAAGLMVEEVEALRDRN